MNKLTGLGLMAAGLIVGYAAAPRLPLQALALSETKRQKCAWPAELDAVAAAPGNHKVVLENERVRVLDVTVKPGEREPLHAHCLPSVMYLMQEGVYRDYDAQGRVVQDVTEAEPHAHFPKTLWLENSPPHSVHNLDARPIRLLRVELKG